MAGADERGAAGYRGVEESAGACWDWVGAFEDAVEKDVSIWRVGVEGVAPDPDDPADVYLERN